MLTPPGLQCLIPVWTSLAVHLGNSFDYLQATMVLAVCGLFFDTEADAAGLGAYQTFVLNTSMLVEFVNWHGLATIINTNGGHHPCVGNAPPML